MTIQPSPTAPLGSVQSLPSYYPSTFLPTAAILCRNTAPLITFAYSLIKRKIPCRVAGREIGQGLLSLLDRLAPTSLDNLHDKLTAFLQREIAKALAKNDEAAAAAVEDKVGCLEAFLTFSSSLQNLRQNIETLFSDTQNHGKVTLSTIHKAKGLEWEQVFILDRQLMPSKFAKSDWQLAQEQNLKYVAVTRAKLDLFYIQSGRWREEGQKEKAKELWELD